MFTSRNYYHSLGNIQDLVSIKNKNRPGMVARTFNPSSLEGGGRKITGHQEFKDQPGQYGETVPLLKIQKLARHGGACL